MAFKSEAQRKKFQELVSQGKMKQDTLDKWEKETTESKLPEKVSAKPIKRLVRKVLRAI